MHAQLLFRLLFLSSLVFLAQGSSAQCVNYGVSQQKGSSNTYNLNIKNSCDTEVYFTVLAMKGDGQIHNLLRGQLKAGERLKHKSYGPFLSVPVGQHVAVDPKNVLQARKTIDSFIRTAQNAKSLDVANGGIPVLSDPPVVSIEE